MRDNFGQSEAEASSHLICQRIVQALIEKYEWVSSQRDDVVKQVLDSTEPEESLATLEWRAYSIVLYDACLQTEDPVRREGGYAELFRFLFRSAYNRWPELAEDATQRALLLVYQQIDRCKKSDGFTGFALAKLRQAFTDEQRARSKPGKNQKKSEISWGEFLEEVGQEGAEAEKPSTLVSRLIQEEGLRVLVDEIKRLPDKRQLKVILLKYFGGLSDEAIADRLGLTAGHVRVLRHRGLAQLRQAQSLRNYFDDKI